ncbi:hypothetical protein V8C86DRAFT_1394254 [Haematococcus lacustris]
MTAGSALLEQQRRAAAAHLGLRPTAGSSLLVERSSLLVERSSWLVSTQQMTAPSVWLVMDVFHLSTFALCLPMTFEAVRSSVKHPNTASAAGEGVAGECSSLGKTVASRVSRAAAPAATGPALGAALSWALGSAAAAPTAPATGWRATHSRPGLLAGWPSHPCTPARPSWGPGLHLGGTLTCDSKAQRSATEQEKEQGMGGRGGRGDSDKSREGMGRAVVLIAGLFSPVREVQAQAIAQHCGYSSWPGGSRLGRMQLWHKWLLRSFWFPGPGLVRAMLHGTCCAWG